MQKQKLNVIEKKDIPRFVEKLMSNFDVFAPQKKEGEVVFEKVTDPKKIHLHYKETHLPPKQFLIPPEEEILKIKNNKILSSKPPKPFVIFGLKLKDLGAIIQLDEIMRRPKLDAFYFQRRNRAILIGVYDRPICSLTTRTCEPFSGFGLPAGGDLLLEKANSNHYTVFALSKEGEKLAKSPLIKEKEVEVIKPKIRKKTRLEEFVLESEITARAVQWSWDIKHPLWDELSHKCLGCGICTYVCPLCFCFSMEDKISIDGKERSRCRRWDACTLPEFAEIAGGHNFRPTIKERYYNWFYHKFYRAYLEYGRAQCVACGRCQKYCPAGIDIEKVLEKVVADYRKTVE